MNVPAILTIYLDHLYEAKQYDQVLQEIENLQETVSTLVRVPGASRKFLHSYLICYIELHKCPSNV